MAAPLKSANILINLGLIETVSVEEDGGKYLSLYLSHFFDFGASFPNERAALAGRDDEPQGDRGFTGGRTVAHRVDYILRGGRPGVIRLMHQVL